MPPPLTCGSTEQDGAAQGAGLGTPPGRCTGRSLDCLLAGLRASGTPRLSLAAQATPVKANDACPAGCCGGRQRLPSANPSGLNSPSFVLSLLHRASSEWKAAALWMTAAGSSSPTVRHSGGMRQPSVMPPLRCIGQHGRRCYKPLSAAPSRSHACHRHSASLSHGPGWNGWLLTTNAVSNPSSVSKKFEQAQVRGRQTT